MFISNSRLPHIVSSVTRARTLPMTSGFLMSLWYAQRRSTSSMKEPFIRHYVDAEPLHMYRPGGYHPILLGDEFNNGRYRVLHKAGWGGHATTWVARDQLESRYVALKVSRSDKSDNDEAGVLQAISALPKDHPGQANLVQILDSFTVNGPNGAHECLVLELLSPSLSSVAKLYKYRRLPATLAKSSAYEALLGLDFLTKLKISHGDLHTNNLAFTLPNLNSLGEPEFFDKLGKPETALVHSIDGAELTSHIPSYLVEPFSFSADDMHQLLRSLPKARVKIIDFGKSFLKDQAPATVNTAMAIRAPEVIFGDKIDHHVDIWSMGCLLFELVTGQPPFDTLLYKTEDHVSQMIEISTDNLPDRWKKKWEEMSVTTCDDDTPYTLQGWLEETYFFNDRLPEFTKHDLSKICQLVGQMLKFEPSSRALVGDILGDPWFTSCSSQKM